VRRAEAGPQMLRLIQYPYTASSTSLNTLIPDWILADGTDSLMQD